MMSISAIPRICSAPASSSNSHQPPSFVWGFVVACFLWQFGGMAEFWGANTTTYTNHKEYHNHFHRHQQLLFLYKRVDHQSERASSSKSSTAKNETKRTTHHRHPTKHQKQKETGSAPSTSRSTRPGTKHHAKEEDGEFLSSIDIEEPDLDEERRMMEQWNHHHNHSSAEDLPDSKVYVNVRVNVSFNLNDLIKYKIRDPYAVLERLFQRRMRISASLSSE